MSKLTITSKIGPGNTITSTVIDNVIFVSYDLVKNIMAVTTFDGTIKTFDINADTTFTMTLSAGVYTLAVS